MISKAGGNATKGKKILTTFFKKTYRKASEASIYMPWMKKKPKPDKKKTKQKPQNKQTKKTNHQLTESGSTRGTEIFKSEGKKEECVILSGLILELVGLVALLGAFLVWFGIFRGVVVVRWS